MSRERALMVLRSPAAHSIYFRISAERAEIRVDKTTFERVATAIENGRVRLRFLAQNLMPNLDADAVYAPGDSDAVNPRYINRFGRVVRANTMFVQPFQDGYKESLLIHEAVHASLDLTRSPDLMRKDDEAAAFIAQFIYCRKTNVPKSLMAVELREAVLPVVDSFLLERRINDALVDKFVRFLSNTNVYGGWRAYEYGRYDG
jgi:hypothetical protein